jgi:hypothetical protein
MAERWFVVCKTCGHEIDLDEEYVPPRVKGIHFVDPAQTETILCRNPQCGSSRAYTQEDFLMRDHGEDDGG